MMKFGTYNYRVQAPNYLLEAGSVTIDDPENKKVVTINLKPNFAQLTINVDNNAEIWVNGEKKGNGSWSGNLGAGTYEFEAKKQGHRSTITTRDIIVTSEPQIINLQSPTPIYGEVDINSTPAMADILVDGQKIGKTPQLINNILIGEHKITVEKNGYDNVSKNVIVEEGKTTNISINLSKTSVSAYSETKYNETVNSPINIDTPQKDDLNNANQLAKKYKRNPEALVKTGRLFFEQGNIIEARRFGNLADEASKHKYAPAFILLGDIEAYANEGSKAIGYYNQATYCDPKDPIGYYKFAMVYRKISPKGAVQKLADLKAQRPDIEVDALSGHIYYLSNEFEKAREAYGKVPVGKMEKNDIVEYAMASYFLGKHAEGLERVKAGLTKEPRNAAMNRLAMFFNTELGNFDEAVQYGDALFNKSDSAKFSYLDYAYLGNAFNGLKQADKAIEQYKLALQCEIDNKARRADVIKQLANAYAEKKDYINAIERYKEYL
ncbi:MAG: PEGA domain-containing protein, partial [Prevotella sp.]|nr:PEGA domain-containing protein [Prevotella sp.]